VLTDFTLAVNDAVDAPAETVTLAGTETEVVLLASAILWPPVRAAALREMVHAVLPAPVKVLVPQLKALIDGAIVDADPLSLIDAVFEVDPCVAVRVTV
jgi:predicted acylesterase/phospholipase RssA